MPTKYTEVDNAIIRFSNLCESQVTGREPCLSTTTFAPDKIHTDGKWVQASSIVLTYILVEDTTSHYEFIKALSCVKMNYVIQMLEYFIPDLDLTKFAQCLLFEIDQIRFLKEWTLLFDG